jgi:nickel/cobalt exporter
MSQEMVYLLTLAVGIGVVHTLTGPDHYLPFIVMAKARRWSNVKTAWITFACGIGHVVASVILGLIGITAGLAVKIMEFRQSARAEYAAWLLAAFGLLYFVWGVRRAIRNKPHTHHHAHAEGEHTHNHTHHDEHAHPHSGGKRSITPWVLFTVFVFGPCELLIPLLMYPAAAEGLWSLTLVVSVYALATISTMMAVVMLATLGLTFLPTPRMQRYNHALAGAVVFLCGVAIHMGL